MTPADRSDDDAGQDSAGSRTGRYTATSRRALLAGGGALGAAAVGGIAGWRVLRSGTRQSGGPPRSGVAGADEGREDFVWVRSGKSGRLRDNQLAFASRHDAAVAFNPPGPDRTAVEDTVRPALEAARSFDVDPWFNVGMFHEASVREFLRKDAERERHLDRLRSIARAYDDLVDGGRVILWQEAPVMGNWAEGEEWGQASVDNLQAYGPAAFEAQKTALQDVNPDLEVGLFVHFPYVVDSKQPEVFAGLAADLRDRGAMPDFGFADYYRGWYEKDVGPDPADAAVRSLVSNLREHLDGRDVFYLGQAHTINPGHTPSRQAVLSNLRASLEAGAAGVGWYLASSYRPTEQGFDPFVPNVADAAFGDGPATTATFARDRYQDAYGATLESRPDVSRADRLDLWLHGDLGFYEHRVAAREVDGDWTFLGDVDGYLDGDYPYAANGTSIFRALSRDRFVSDGELELRIETSEAADAPSLETVVAMPWDHRDFVTAAEASRLLEESADVAAYELGRVTTDRSLPSDEGVTVTVPVEGEPRSLRSLVHPEHTDAVQRLERAEGRDGFDHAARFDLWYAGSGLETPADGPSLRGPDGDAVDPTEAAAVSVSTSDVALYYGLERERFFGEGLTVKDDASGGTDVDAAYAMPYAGRANFRPPTEAASLLADQPGEVATFSIDSVDRS